MSRRIWVIDTSSVIGVKQQLEARVQPRIFKALDALVENGALVFPKQVVMELDEGYTGSKRDSDLPLNWIKRNEERGCWAKTDWDLVKLVLASAENLVDEDRTSGIEPADPYVLSLAKHLADDGHRVVVLTEDRNDKPKKMSLATACGLFDIASLPVLAFLKQQGIWPIKE